MTGEAAAQTEVPAPTREVRFSESFWDEVSLWDSQFHFALQTSEYGQEDTRLYAGMRGFTPFANGELFLRAQYKAAFTVQQSMGLNFGAGLRRPYASRLGGGSTRIFGGSLWYDGDLTDSGIWFNQVGISLESLGELWDLRFNAHIPVGKMSGIGGDEILTDEFRYIGNNLTRSVWQTKDTALSVTDFEFARRIWGQDSLWLFAGGYSLSGGGTSDFGYKWGLRAHMHGDVMLQLSMTGDEVFDTKAAFTLVWYPGASAGAKRRPCGLLGRMRDPVIRNYYVAVRQDAVKTGRILTYDDEPDTPITVVHVNSNATGPGDGTFESPFTSLEDVYDNSTEGDIVLVHAESAFDGESIVLRDQQRLLGEGGGETHTVLTAQFVEEIELPETSEGARQGTVPVIANAPGDAVTLVTPPAERSIEDPASFNEVSNLTIDGGTRGVVSPGGIAEADVNRLTISNTTGHGIELTPVVETLEEFDSEQVLFFPTINRVALENVGGNGIHLDATAAVPAATPAGEDIQISEVTATGGAGYGIAITKNRSEATIDEYSYDGGTTAAGGLLLNESDAGAAVSDSAFQNAGTGIEIVDSDGSFTFTETYLTDTGDAALRIEDGAANVTFNGKITQGSNAAAVAVSDGHTGTVAFTEFLEDEGIVEATAGTGLQFDEADGFYTFNNAVDINGAANAVAIVDSDGTFTFADAQVTDTTGTSVSIEGGTANVTYTGKITQGNNAAAVAVSGEHTGFASFNEAEQDEGIVEASGGAGLQFDNADGSYSFNSAVSIDGADTGIAIANGSEGTFTFANSSEITNATNTAFHVSDSGATVTYNGTIENSQGRAALLEGNDDGTVTFGGAITDTGEGILVQNNTGGTFQFNGPVDLDTGANDAVTLLNNQGATEVATVTFSNLDINTTSGAGFTATGGGTVRVSGSENTINTTTGVGASLDGVEIAAGGANFQSVSVDGAANGILLNEVTGGTFAVGAGGASAGDGGVIQNTTGDGVAITNTANVSLNYLQVTGATGNGVTLNHDDADTFQVAIAESSISNTGAQGLDLNASGSGSLTLTLNDNAIDNTAQECVDLDFSGDAELANVTLNGNTIVDSSGNTALLVTASGATSKTINLLVSDNNQIANDDPANPAADIQANGTVDLNATVHDNVFDNDDTVSGRPFEISANDAGANVRLSLLDNRATNNNPEDEYFLIQNAGSFSLELLTVAPGEDDVHDRNDGVINITGTVTNDPGGIPTP